jgi:uncharacterized protein HemY
MNKPSSAELRMMNLRRELDVETESSIRAAILYQMAWAYEHEVGSMPDALQHYASALEAAPDFQPAAMARLRIEERANAEELPRPTLEASIAAAHEPNTRSSALVDLALRSDRWSSLLREAVEEASDKAVPALLLEWLADARSDPDALRDALRAQAESSSDPTLQAALWLDFALAELESGEVDVALGALGLAAKCEALAWPALSLQRRIAEEQARWRSYVQASVAMAERLERDAPGDPLDLSVPLEEQLPLASLLWEEAARVSLDKLQEPERAAEQLDAALRLSPEDPELRWQRLRLAEAEGQANAIHTAADWFRAQAPRHPAFVAHQVRQSLRRADDPTSLEELREAASTYAESPYVQAAFDLALARSGSVDERLERFRSRAATTEGEARTLLLWRSARLAAQELESEPAQALFTESASEPGPWKAAILRDALSDALRKQDGDAIVLRVEQLLETDPDTEEYSRLCFCRYEVTRRTLGNRDEAKRLLEDALLDERHADWAPSLARARAELDQDLGLLGRAHEALAQLATSDGSREHRLAAGQAYADARDWSSAERVLREALEDGPQDRQILGALEAVLRQAGRPDAIVDLVRTGAGPETLPLLQAGASAERGHALETARDAYLEALGRAPTSASAALALAQLGRRSKQHQTWMDAYDRLASLELGGGVPELFALTRADALRGSAAGSARSSDEYERGLEHPVTTVASAVALLSLPVSETDEEQRIAAEEILTDAGAELEPRQDALGTAYQILRGSLGRADSFAAEAWLELGRLTESDALRASTLLQAMRETRIAQGESSMDDLFIMAQQHRDLASEHPEAAIALDEVLAPGDDAELRASALAWKLSHSRELGRDALVGAHCRALVEAERGEEAVALLSSAIDERPDDLSLWETLRGAARQAEQWPLVAQACERLAGFVEGSLRADLLEEAGAVRLDHLGQQAQAEDAFRSALEAEPGRTLAFDRLHELLTEQEDAEALEALVSERLRSGGAKERPELLYERARLLRGFSDRPGALEVLGELFGAEPEHAGALALAAEVHVSLEQWDDAVECLQRLSRSEIADDQRRIALLGSADFLENRLNRPEDALLELDAVDALGLADVDTRLRIGSLAERLGRTDEAIEAYRRVLREAPECEPAVDRLVELGDGEERKAVAAGYEATLWRRMQAVGLELPLLASIRKAATWQGALERGAAVAAVEEALQHDLQASTNRAEMDHVGAAALWQGRQDSVFEALIRCAGPALSSPRLRSNKLGLDTPAVRELERVAERFGARFGSVSLSEQANRLHAYLDRDESIHWILPAQARDGLDAGQRFEAARLAWAVPRGAGALVSTSPQEAAGATMSILLAARRTVTTGGPSLPSVPVKLRRSVRKRVAEVVGDRVMDTNTILEGIEALQQNADRAGLLWGGDIGTALRAVLGTQPDRNAARSSPRALALVHFWAAPDSPRWGTHG